MIVRANGNSVLARRKRTGIEFIRFLRRIADAGLRLNDDPIAAINTVLSTFDAAGSVPRCESHHKSRGMAGLRFDRLCLQAIDDGRGVVDEEAFAFAFGG